MKLKYTLLVLLVVLFGCSENIPPPNGQGQDTCLYNVGSNDDPWAVETIWQTRDFNFTRPCFNPSNSDEFVYIRYEQQWLINGNYELRKHTISNNQDILVCNLNSEITLISWDLLGWIYFCDQYTNIWKVHDDGTQLIQLTACQGMYHQCVSPNGNFIVVNQLAPSPIIGQTVILDNNGIFIDTIADKYVPTTWVNDTLLFMLYPSISTYGIWKLMSYPDKSILATDTFPNQTSLVESIGNNKIMYSDGYSLFIYDLQSKTQALVKEFCGYRYRYESFSYSPVDNKILVEREKIKPIDTLNHTYFIQRDIVLMNIDGTNEQILELPQ